MGLALGGAESHLVHDSHEDVLIPAPHQHLSSPTADLCLPDPGCTPHTTLHFASCL